MLRQQMARGFGLLFGYMLMSITLRLANAIAVDEVPA
jgi:hypothetical protein